MLMENDKSVKLTGKMPSCTSVKRDPPYDGDPRTLGPLRCRVAPMPQRAQENAQSGHGYIFGRRARATLGEWREKRPNAKFPNAGRRQEACLAGQNPSPTVKLGRVGEAADRGRALCRFAEAVEAWLERRLGRTHRSATGRSVGRWNKHLEGRGSARAKPEEG